MAHGIAGEEVAPQQVPVMDLMRKTVPEADPGAFGAGIGQAAAGLGNVVQQKYVADSATWAGDQLAQARVKAVQNLEAMKQALPPGDPGDFAGKFVGQFEKDNAPILASADGNPVAQRMVTKGLGELKDTLQQHAVAFEASQRVAYRTDSVDQNLKTQLSAVEAHPELYQQVGSTLHDQMVAIGLPNEKLYPALRQMDAQLSEAAANGLARQDPHGALQALNDPENAPAQFKPLLSGLSDQQRESLRTKATAGISANYADTVIGAYRSGGPALGAKVFASIDKIDEPADIKAAIYQHVETGLGQWRQEQQQTHAQDILGLEERLASGKPGSNDRGIALGLWRSGAWDAAKTGETIGRIEKVQEKAVDDNSLELAATDAYRRGVPLDPKDKDIRAGIDATFQTATKGVQPGSPEWINRAADIGAKTGVTPDSVISWSRTQLVGGDPKAAASAAQAIQRVQDANPRGTPFALDDKDKTMARLVNDAVAAGTDPIVAVENARRVTALPDADVKRLDEVYKQKQVGQKAENDLKTELKGDPTFRPHIWNSIPDVPPQMVGQFEQLRQTYFKLTDGNADQAAKLAAADLKQTWGLTQVNGAKEIMQFAPEAMHPGLTTDAVRTDMETSAKGHTDDPTKVRLIATPDTYQSNGQRWGLGVPDKFGAYSVLTDDKGRVLPYQLPPATDATKAAYAKAAADGLAKLHEAQAIEREREKNLLGEIQVQGRQAGY